MAMICRDYNLLFIMVPATACSAIGSILQERFGGQWLPEQDIFHDGKLVVGRKHCSLPELLEHNLVSAEELNGMITFATVRNPLDRLTTQYERATGPWVQMQLGKSGEDDWLNRGPANHKNEIRERMAKRAKITSDLGFDEWLLRRLRVSRPSTPVKWLKANLRRLLKKRRTSRERMLYPLIDGVEHVMRYENLEHDFNEVLKKAGIEEHVPIPRSGQSGTNPTDRTPNKRPFADYYTPKLRKIVEREIGEELRAFGYSIDH